MSAFSRVWRKTGLFFEVHSLLCQFWFLLQLQGFVSVFTDRKKKKVCLICVPFSKAPESPLNAEVSLKTIWHEQPNTCLTNTSTIAPLISRINLRENKGRDSLTLSNRGCRIHQIIYRLINPSFHPFHTNHFFSKPSFFLGSSCRSLEFLSIILKTLPLGLDGRRVRVILW